MRVAIIGAGVAGLAAARVLTEAGCAPTVYEKGPEVGGRITTRRLGPYTFDSGATSVNAAGRAIEGLILEKLDKSDLVEVDRPIYSHRLGRVVGADPVRGRGLRYCYSSGIDRLVQMMAEGLDVRLNCDIDTLGEIPDGGYTVDGGVFDAAIVTVPVPQAAMLLDSLGETRSFQNCKFRPCLSVLLGFESGLQTPFHSLIDPEQQEPLNWLSIETVKVPGNKRAPEGCTAMVAQLGARYSEYSFDHEDAKIIQDTIVDIVRLVGKPFAVPAVSEVKRWRYSQPETTASFDSVNRPGSRLLVAGDGLSAGRIPDAYDSGVRAARRLLEDM